VQIGENLWMEIDDGRLKTGPTLHRTDNDSCDAGENRVRMFANKQSVTLICTGAGVGPILRSERRRPR
jgi:hypothetical protein